MTLDSCAETVAGCLEGLSEPAVLVGHSFGGAVLSQVCELRPEAVQIAVYLCAFLLRNGQSAWRHGGVADGVLNPKNLRVDTEAGTVDLDPALIPEGFYNGCARGDRDRALTFWRPEPLAPLKSELALSEDRFGRVPRTYFGCSEDRVISPAAQARMLRLTPCSDVRTMKGGHSPFLSDPSTLAGHLHTLARRPGTTPR